MDPSLLREAVRTALAARRAQLQAEIAALDAQIANPTPPSIGDRLLDGSVYAGLSPTTGAPFFLTNREVGAMTWPDAQKAAKTRRYGGHADWRLPTVAEMRHLYKHRKALGIDESNSEWPWTYWTSDEKDKKTAKDFCMVRHKAEPHAKHGHVQVRFVRG
jgi:hypothetical protein